MPPKNAVPENLEPLPKRDTIKLISAEGDEFVVDRKAALISGTIKALLTGPGSYQESGQGEIRFPEISSPILECVCQYFYYKLRYSDSTGKMPEFKIRPEVALDLLMASNYLDA